MDVRRKLVGLALCCATLVAGLPWVSSTSTSRADGALTIDGQFESAGPIGAGETRNLVVTGRGGVPSTGVGAVALNVTVTNPTRPSFITAFPTGTARPTSANLNFVPGQTVPNMVVVKVGEFGQVSFYNFAGNVDLVVDVAGWFPEGGFTGLTPARLADSRTGYPTIDGQLSGTGRLGAGEVSEVPVLDRGGVPATGVGAVAVNVTVVNPSAASFLTVYPTGATRPTSANLNYLPGDVVPNMVIVKVGAGGKISMYNYAGTTDIVVDVMGWFPEGNSFSGITPARLMDTRAGYPTIDGQFSGTGAIQPNSTRDLVVVGRDGVPATGVGAVVLNVTATNPTDSSFLTVFPTGSARPLAANLNFVANQTVPNAVIAKVGAGGQISIYNLKGSVDVVIDVMGWFPEGVAYEGLVPARLMDTRPGGQPTEPTLPTTTVAGSTSTTGTTGPGGPTTTAFPTTTTVPEPPPAPWTEQTLDMPIVPRIDTPRINDGEIFDIEVVGDDVYVMGSFTSVQESDDAAAGGTDGQVFNQSALIKYSRVTGLLDRGFTPTFQGGGLFAIEAAPDGSGLFVAGSFTNTNNETGAAVRARVVKLDPDDGSVITAFDGRSNFRATALATTATTVYVGGEFDQAWGPDDVVQSRRGLAAFDIDTGVLNSFDIPITGGLGLGGLNGMTVQQLNVTPDQSKLIVYHTGRQMAGQDRYGVGIVDIPGGTLNGWRTNLWQDNLIYVGNVQRIYNGAVSPDGTYFVATSGSGGDRPPINDTAMAFPVADGAGLEQPLWVSRHFDSVYGIAISEDAVFVGGHFSWQESPRAPDPWPGLDNVGYGNGQGLSGYGLGDDVVRREQLGALDPTTGKALEWNPMTNGNEGVKAMEWVDDVGLFVGVDVPVGNGGNIGGVSIGNTGFFDLDDYVDPNDNRFTRIRTPYDGVVEATSTAFELAGEAWTTVPGETVRRVNVQIQRKGTTQYLCADGTVGATCDLDGPGGNAPVAAGSLSLSPTLNVAPNTSANATWSMQITLPDDPDEWDVFARAFFDPNPAITGEAAVQDNVRAKSYLETFSFDDAAPTTAITAPIGSLINTTTFTVTGTAADDIGVQSVSYVWWEQNLDVYLQDDGTLAPQFNSFPGEVADPGAQSTTWEQEFTLPEGYYEFTVSATDTGNQTELRGASRDWLIDTDAVAPSVQIQTPVVWNPPPPPSTTSTPVLHTSTPGSGFSFSGTASDELGVAAVQVFIRNTTTREGLTADGVWGPNAVANFHRITPANLNATAYNWSFDASSIPGFSLTPGVWDIRVRAIDNQDLVSVSGRITMTVQHPGDAFPDGLLSFTGISQNLNAASDLEDFTITGNATDNSGVAEVRIALQDLDTSTYLNASGQKVNGFTTVNATLASAGATSTGFTLVVDLPTQGEWNITAFAVDVSGQMDTSTVGATARYLIYPGDIDPVLVSALTQPTEGQTLALGGISIGGRAEDDNNPTGGISAVRINIRQGTGNWFSTATGGFTSATPSNINAFLTSPAPAGGNPGSNFNYATPSASAAAFTAGTYTITITPVDRWGQTGTPINVNVTLA